MMTPENTRLIIVDIQERLLPALHENQAFLAACRQFITGANLLGVPHIITEQYPKGLGATVPDIALLTPDAPKFSKTQFSAYTAEVAAALQSRQPENKINPFSGCLLACGLRLAHHTINLEIALNCGCCASLSSINSRLSILLTTPPAAWICCKPLALLAAVRDVAHSCGMKTL